MSLLGSEPRSLAMLKRSSCWLGNISWTAFAMKRLRMVGMSDARMIPMADSPLASCWSMSSRARVASAFWMALPISKTIPWRERGTSWRTSSMFTVLRSEPVYRSSFSSSDFIWRVSSPASATKSSMASGSKLRLSDEARFSTSMATCSSQPSFEVSSLLCSMMFALALRYLKSLRLLWMAVAEMMNWMSSPMPFSRISRSDSRPSLARAASPVRSVPM